MREGRVILGYLLEIVIKCFSAVGRVIVSLRSTLLEVLQRGEVILRSSSLEVLHV